MLCWSDLAIRKVPSYLYMTEKWILWPLQARADLFSALNCLLSADDDALFDSSETTSTPDK